MKLGDTFMHLKMNTSQRILFLQFFSFDTAGLRASLRSLGTIMFYILNAEFHSFISNQFCITSFTSCFLKLDIYPLHDATDGTRQSVDVYNLL